MHFRDKDEILHEICYGAMKALLAQNSEIAARPLDAVTRVRLMLDAYVRMGLDHPNAYRLVFCATPRVTIGDSPMQAATARDRRAVLRVLPRRGARDRRRGAPAHRRRRMRRPGAVGRLPRPGGADDHPAQRRLGARRRADRASCSTACCTASSPTDRSVALAPGRRCGARARHSRAIAGWLASLALAAPASPRRAIVSLDQCADQYVLALAPRDEIVGALQAGAERRLARAGPRASACPSGAPAWRRRWRRGRPSRCATGRRTRACPTALQRCGVHGGADRRGQRLPRRRAPTSARSPPRSASRAAGEALVARMDAQLAPSHGAWGGARALYLTPGGFTAGRGHAGRRDDGGGGPGAAARARPATRRCRWRRWC